MTWVSGCALSFLRQLTDTPIPKSRNALGDKSIVVSLLSVVVSRNNFVHNLCNECVVFTLSKQKQIMSIGCNLWSKHSCECLLLPWHEPLCPSVACSESPLFRTLVRDVPCSSLRSPFQPNLPGSVHHGFSSLVQGPSQNLQTPWFPLSV